MNAIAAPLAHGLGLYVETWGTLWPSDPAHSETRPRIVDRFLDLMESDDCFERTHLPGHLTGSGLLVTPDWGQCLLTHHRKLGRWLQLGGHADGDPRVDVVALREAQEESGIDDVSFSCYGNIFGLPGAERLILDIDIHSIPARKDEPEHEHYDVRYLVETAHPERLKISPESTELRWFPIEEAFQVTWGRSMHRLLEKLVYLRRRRG
jgi:8-oxo-dGTP pyrophosphatase MutT (NUDIX family)